MNDDIDEILEALGMNNTPNTTTSEVATVNNVEISDADLRDILEDNGIETSEEADAVEITENSETSSIEEPVIMTANMEELRANSAIQPAEDTWEEFHLSDVAEATYALNNLQEEGINEAMAIPASAMDTPTQETQDTSLEEPVATIPENSPTLLIDETTSRFSGAEWYNEVQSKNIVIAGLGGIGSWAALNIARFKPNRLVLYDGDRVERVNLSGQFFSEDDIGNYKTSAVATAIRKYTNCSCIFCRHERFTENSEGSNIMICGFDNMEARKVFFRKWKRLVSITAPGVSKNCLFIDGRLSVDTLQIFCITGDDTYNMHLYEKEYLFDDSEADATVCSLKQTSYMANMIGSLMANLLINFIANTSGAVLPYDVPFLTEYDAQNMIFKTKK